MLSVLKKGSTLCDAFCGCGPMTIRAAKKGVNVLANDLNPDGVNYLKSNVTRNRVNNNVKCFNLDARLFIRNCIRLASLDKEEVDEINFDQTFPSDTKIDHIYMNLPKDAFEFLDVFSGLFKNTKYTKEFPLPVVHVYGFSPEESAYETLVDRAEKAMKGKIGEVLNFVKVREISTKKFVYCLSFRISEEVGF